ncbi:Pkinase domain-containing protein [Rhizoctonia solani AG-1 IA]|uniref:Pkinase domain-containing protein n=1 Tax=Thanatephorus cucumeris (strain AG1-IA) TaxID=983506 RepID=L8WS85_THACA|nr:Pkinase domain-containing protein [Rhizoctonia solani AG-1 IA]
MSNLSYQALRFPDVSSLTPEELSEAEKNWVHFQPYLVSKGYQLRPRYRPGWVPSWKLSGANPYDCEDSIDSLPTRLLDAVRIKDDLRVVIKMIIPYDDDEEGEEERNILRYLSSEKCVDDPTNHAVRCLDSFSIPGVERGSFCIMPWLTAYHVHRFNNLEEIHELLVQLFEGLEFLHRNNIVHCDIAPSNIMMDVGRLHNGPFNPFIQNFASCHKYMAPLKLRRSNKSVRYYYIDFGYAKWFRYVQRNRMIKGTRARERAPEQVEGQLYDPFMVDVYQLGALIRRDLIPSFSGDSQSTYEYPFYWDAKLEDALAYSFT